VVLNQAMDVASWLDTQLSTEKTSPLKDTVISVFSLVSKA
jgi:hypothetical protein